MDRPLPIPAWAATPVIALVAVLGILGSGCETEQQVRVQSGADVLAHRDFETVAGSHVGLIVNHTARVDTAHLIDRIDQAPQVELGALFGPEHGLRGQSGAGEHVSDGRDGRTGVPVYSLYDETRRPTREEMKGLDALVFDVQDVGARFYTYITTMGRAMQAAAEANLRFVVLDRPNPLGGEYVSGFVMEPEHESFIGRYPLPVAHGMTVGELARFIRGEDLLPGVDSLDLEVVPMKGWERDMQWPDTGRPWRPPSPNLPTWNAALVYPGTCFFEAIQASEGRGTDRPFLQIGLPWDRDAAARVTRRLQQQAVPGVRFDTTSFTPTSRPEAAPSPRFEGQMLYGFRIQITDRRAVQPVELGIYALSAVREEAANIGAPFVARSGHLTRLAGTKRLQTQIANGVPPDSIIASWQPAVEQFRARRSSYLLY